MTAYRVIFGWSNYRDFDTYEEAREFQLSLADIPVHSPYMGEVRVVEVTETGVRVLGRLWRPQPGQLTKFGEKIW